jgi:hypothetical protein
MREPSLPFLAGGPVGSAFVPEPFATPGEVLPPMGH